MLNGTVMTVDWQVSSACNMLYIRLFPSIRCSQLLLSSSPSDEQEASLPGLELDSSTGLNFLLLELNSIIPGLNSWLLWLDSLPGLDSFIGGLGSFLRELKSIGLDSFLTGLTGTDSFLPRLTSFCASWFNCITVLPNVLLLSGDFLSWRAFDIVVSAPPCKLDTLRTGERFGTFATEYAWLGLPGESLAVGPSVSSQLACTLCTSSWM